MTLPVTQVDLEIRVYGMRRSGNHAIIQWILAQSEGVTEFFNDVSPEAPYAKEPIYGNWDSPEPPSHIALSVVSYEDRSFEILIACEKKFIQTRTPSHRIDLLIVRDPFNMFASRLHSPYIKAWKPAYICGLTATQLAEDYLEAYLNQHLPQAHHLQLITANFNHWMNDTGYRKELANAFKLPFSDKGMDNLSRFGGGSSFEEISTNPHEMNLDERWKQCIEIKEYKNKLHRKKLLKFAKAAFPETIISIQTLFPTRETPKYLSFELNRIFLTPIVIWLRSQAHLVRLYRLLQFKPQDPKTISN